MSSVGDILRCNCGGTCIVDLNCDTEEEYRFCDKCGYLYNKEAERGKDDKIVFDENGNLIYTIEEFLNSCGAYNLVLKTGERKTGTLGENVREEDVLTIFSLMLTSDIDLDESYINYRNPKTGEFKILLGNKKPLEFDE